jgi:iron complex outermembrane recepter protein
MRKTTTCRGLYRSAWGLAVLALHGAAQAQGTTGGRAESRDKSVLADIIVTARKVEENLQTVPIAISQFSGEALESQTVRSIGDMQYQLPNVFFQQSTADAQALTIAMRGQKQNDVPPTVDPSVGIYIDGIYYPRTIGLMGALIDVDRVEVLRGPQGTLYGRNTTGGAFSVYTKDPTDEFEGSATVEVGNYDAWNLKGVVNLPISQNFAARIVGQRGKRDGYGEDAAGQQLNDDDSRYIRGKLRAEFDRVEAVLSGIHQKNETGSGVYGIAIAPASATGTVEGGAGTLEIAAESGLPFTPEGLTQAVSIYRDLAARDPYNNGATYPALAFFEGNVASLDVKAELPGDLSLRSITAYQDMERDTADDHDSTPFTILGLMFNQKGHYWSQELQLLGGGSTLNWVIGAYAGDEKQHYKETADVLAFLLGGLQQISEADIRNKTIAGFAQANWEFFPKWRVTAGVRYSSDERTVDSNNRLGTVCTVPAPGVSVTGVLDSPLNGPSQCPREFSETFSEPSWLISVDHQFNDDLFAYAKVARGFRTGGLNFRGANFAESFSPFDPEFVTEYEIGIKWDVLPDALRVNVAVFYDDYKDAQRSIAIAGPNNVPVGLTTNAASGEISGAELEAQLTPVRGLSISAAVGYLDASYTEFADISGDRSDESFGVPDWSASGTVSYEIPTRVGALTPQVDYHWQSETIIDPTARITLDSVTQSSYGLLNARVSLDIDAVDMTVAAFGKNLTDKLYLVNASVLESSIGFNQLIYGDPRIWGVSVTKRF